MKEIQCPFVENSDEEKHISVFLAGGITNCPNWQQDVVDAMSALEGIIYNPRRDKFDVSNKSESVKQIEWEFNMMKRSKIILFWFPEESVCPISLYEIGRCNALHPLNDLVVGTHKNYTRRLDVIEQSRMAGRLVDGGEIHDELSKLISALKTKIRSYNGSTDTD